MSASPPAAGSRFRAATLQDEAGALLQRYPRPAGALLPLIDLVLRSAGGWDPQAISWISGLTGLPEATVQGIVSTRVTGPAGEVRVCAGLSCRLMGAEEVLERLRQRLGDRVTVVDCLGVCSAAPALERGGRLFDGLTERRIEALLAGDA